MKSGEWGKIYRQARKKARKEIGMSINDKRTLLETDNSERFVLRSCLQYMEKLFGRYLTFDKGYLAILSWILGERFHVLIGFIVSNLRGSARTVLLEDIQDTEDDHEEKAVLAHGGIKKLPRKCLKDLGELLFQQIEMRMDDLRYTGNSEIENNIQKFQDIFLLSEQERSFVEFLYIVCTYDHMEQYFIDYLECQKISQRKLLAAALGFSQKELNDVMKGTLAQIGAFEIDRHSLSMEDDFLDYIFNPSSDVLSKYYFTPKTTESVPFRDHFFEREQIDYAVNLLTRDSDHPVNILLYGPGGTGKTSFAHGLSRELKLPIYEIARDEENKSKMRRAAIHACLNMTSNHRSSLIVVDEADNVLNTRSSWLMRGETQDKGWLNQILERKGARIIWITNHIENIEETVLRRFSYSLHFKPFNQGQRKRLWETILKRNKVKRFVPSDSILQLAKRYRVSAGAIDMAVKKAVQVGWKSREEFIRLVTLNLDSHEMLMNGGDKPKVKDMIEKNYSLDGLNIQGDLHAMINQLEKYDQYLRKSKTDRKINMNLLFYGPPGTGKSELARYIADHLDREIICKRASDILDPYVGGTEQKIKLAFEEAEAEEAVMIIDEVDSLLFSRDRAHRSWEISHTNEFLTQMERFKGILICTTNRLRDLDQASIRRFNLKMGFDYLKPDGNVIFYQKFLSPLTNTRLDEITKGLLRKMTNLAPGDFKVVRDKNSFHRPEDLDHQVLVQALREEARIKKLHGGKKNIGF